MLNIDRGRPPVPPRDAATVVLLREASPSFEVFLVCRHAKSGFMAGAHVFPGGKLDEADASDRLRARVDGRSAGDAASALGEDDPERAVALFVAAVRETFEEAGVLLADVSPGTDLDAARARLASGASFADVVESVDARLRLDHLVPLARWVTPEVEQRRFDARFFLALAPTDQIARHDEHETTSHVWIAPRAALEAAASGRIQLPPPTLRNLELLANFARADDALAHARAHPPPLVRPVFMDKDGLWILTLPGDPEHFERERVIDGPTRFVLVDGTWLSRDP